MTFEEAIQAAIEGTTNPETLATIIAGQANLTRQIHFAIPKDELYNEEWEAVVQGSQAVCSEGDHRVILPGAQREQFEGGQTVQLTATNGVLLHLSGTSPHAAFMRMQLMQGGDQYYLALIQNPFDQVTQIMMQLQGVPAAPLSEVPALIEAQRVFSNEGVPVAMITAVDGLTVTVQADRDVSIYVYEAPTAAQEEQQQGTEEETGE